MPFIHNYNGAIKILSGIGTGKCKGSCKTIWTRNIKYALKTKTNPLKLTKKERKNLTKKLKMVSKKDSINQHSKTLKNIKIKAENRRLIQQTKTVVKK